MLLMSMVRGVLRAILSPEVFAPAILTLLLKVGVAGLLEVEEGVGVGECDR
ncbi:hypothetical protein VB713_25025 [Anabaena cylindrica UHCC 0172]|uniref:hypothetical protein n=1 Tax=Anabaena cylindrica TaxID=1165 RepID=UPI002B21720F|nr:hypothetical protein [Anabaena cylindrica]MEA5554203.1 hypothetical protein [Anabaena cylindrica UHCC 0172]